MRSHSHVGTPNQIVGNSGDGHAHGGRHHAPHEVVNKKVQVHNGDIPSEDRFVSLTTHRLLATDVFVVGVVDGTGRLAEPRTLLTSSDYERARRQANKLVQERGKVEPTHYAEHLLSGNAGRQQYGLPKRPKRIAKGRIAYVEEPERKPNGRWVVTWFVPAEGRERSKTFDTKRQASAFHARLREEMD